MEFFAFGHVSGPFWANAKPPATVHALQVLLLSVPIEEVVRDVALLFREVVAEAAMPSFNLLTGCLILYLTELKEF